MGKKHLCRRNAFAEELNQSFVKGSRNKQRQESTKTSIKSSFQLFSTLSTFPQEKQEKDSDKANWKRERERKREKERERERILERKLHD